MGSVDAKEPQAPGRIRVVFVITDLDPGGAERMLLKVASRLSDRFDASVVSLLAGGELQPDFERIGVPVHSLNMTGLKSVASAVARLARHIRRLRPDVVSTWMYHADLVGGMAVSLAGSPPLAWNIRNSDLSADSSGLATRTLVRLNARLSHRLPSRILCCSEVARRIHVELGYDSRRFLLIPNGFDLSEYHPSSRAAQSVRRELDISCDAPLIGMLARWHPQKNHHGFIAAAALLKERFPRAQFILAGSGCGPSNRELTRWISDLGLAESVRLLGHRTDIPRLTAALDIACLSSVSGEAFPNVLGEAMACGVPCVATDVGDSALIIGDTGKVVPPGDSDAFANACAELLGMTEEARRNLGEAARKRVQDHFDLSVVSRLYERAFLDLASGSGASRKAGAHSCAE